MATVCALEDCQKAKRTIAVKRKHNSNFRKTLIESIHLYTCPLTHATSDGRDTYPATGILDCERSADEILVHLGFLSPARSTSTPERANNPWLLHHTPRCTGSDCNRRQNACFVDEGLYAIDKA